MDFKLIYYSARTKVMKSKPKYVSDSLRKLPQRSCVFRAFLSPIHSSSLLTHKNAHIYSCGWEGARSFVYSGPMIYRRSPYEESQFQPSFIRSGAVRPLFQGSPNNAPPWIREADARRTTQALIRIEWFGRKIGFLKYVAIPNYFFVLGPFQS